MADVVIVDASSGAVIERDFTPEERARFFAKLAELGLPYEEAVAPWHEHFHKCRPSALPQAKRNDLLAYLGTPGGRAEVTGFVAQAATVENHRLLVAAITSLAASEQLTVIAGGIETPIG